MKKLLALSSSVACCGASIYLASAPLLARQTKDFPDPTPRKAAILKLFVDELIDVTPGKGHYPARFIMGTNDGPASEQPAHPVAIAKPFAMAKYEVTQELYQVIVGKNPAKWKGPRNSVEMVDWKEANDFCTTLTEALHDAKLLAKDEKIRLPSEAEWEYVCRAGTTTDYSFGAKLADLTHFAWYKDNAPGNDPPVGSKRGNAWGFHEMHGYVSEWCLDPWHANYANAPEDGSVWTRAGDAQKHVVRGGSFADEPSVLRSAARQAMDSKTRSDKLGFRCVKESAK